VIDDATERTSPDAGQLSVEEQLSLLSGADFWHTREVRHGDDVIVRALLTTDGPHGVRKQPEEGDHLGIGDSIPATCFPPAVTLGSTWDVGLAREFGTALGSEARHLGVDVILGPGVNIKRSPLGGRNFEYVSEDPALAGDLASNIIAGIQSTGVAASLKHFAVNNQETDRMRISADVSERALREVYLEVFRRAVTNGRPWTVMTSYNKINGVFAAENEWLLRDVLRGEWGFDGVIVSDWGGVTDRVASLRAGLDLNMPGPGLPGLTDLRTAHSAGGLDPELVAESVRRITALAKKTARTGKSPAPIDHDMHHRLARRIATAGSVLLRNERDADGVAALPLSSASQSIVVVGELARTPRFQGSGSSQVVPTRLDTPLDAIRTSAGHDVVFAAGYSLTGEGPDLRDEAVKTATGRTAIVFLGLPPDAESEGYDREGLDLPAAQTELLSAIAAVAARVVVVLQNGSPVSIADWSRDTDAILETWLGGQAGGSAVADLLFGRENPSGRLAETIPLRIEDTPSFTNFPGEGGHVTYGEGVFVGYRHYDSVDREVAYPFGHGLSYTTFAYSDLTLESGPARDQTTVRGVVTNVGERRGAEVVQLYIEPVGSGLRRPPRELKHFSRFDLEPGESAEFVFAVTEVDLRVWDPSEHRWTVHAGTAGVSVGASSRDIRTRIDLPVEGAPPEPTAIDEWSTLGEALGNPLTAAAIRAGSASGDFHPMSAELERMAAGMPLRMIADFEGMLFDRHQLTGLLDAQGVQPMD
jgi:beta-glucosidase